jgi:hypothetical protein
MNHSELILKTYREITFKLEKPYYILEGIPANNGNDQILYSSPTLKEMIGLTQYELSSNPKLFFDSIHPDFIVAYLESNKRLLKGSEKEKRAYLVKNKETGEFISVVELASSRLNKERNCYEIYCSLRSMNDTIDINSLENRTKISDTTHHFVNSMSAHFKLSACRLYGFNEATKELTIFADVQVKKPNQILESATRIKTRSIVPHYSKDNLLFKYLLDGKYKIIEDRAEIMEILKAHADNSIIKKLASTAIRLFQLKSFAIFPICCPDGKIVGLVTFGSGQIYSDEQKKEIYDFVTTNTSVFTCLLDAACSEALVRSEAAAF